MTSFSVELVPGGSQYVRWTLHSRHLVHSNDRCVSLRPNFLALSLMLVNGDPCGRLMTSFNG